MKFTVTMQILLRALRKQKGKDSLRKSQVYLGPLEVTLGKARLRLGIVHREARALQRGATVKHKLLLMERHIQILVATLASEKLGMIQMIVDAIYIGYLFRSIIVCNKIFKLVKPLSYVFCITLAWQFRH
jgi:hypothetical protein